MLVLTIVFSIFLTLILVPIRFQYHEEAPWQKAKYNIFVNGPITKHDYLNITKDPNIVNVAVTNYGSGEVYKGSINDKFIETTIPVYSVLINRGEFNDTSKLDIIGLNSFFISGTLKSGDSTFGYAAISWDLAKQLGVDIGDTVIYIVGDSKYQYKISGITIPTSETEFVIDDMGVFDQKNEDEIYAGNLYILSKNQKTTMEYLQSYILQNKKEWTPITIENKQAKILAYLKLAIPPIIKFGFIGGGMILYLTVLLREQNIAINNKKRNFSILTALGTSKTKIMNIYITEQILMMIIISFFAVLISKFLIFQTLFKLYIPVEVLFQGMMIGIALNIIAVIFALFYTKRRISKIPVAELLREES